MYIIGLISCSFFSKMYPYYGRPDADSPSLVATMFAMTSSAWVGVFIPPSLSNACSNGVTCPLEKGRGYSYVTTITVPEELETVSV